MRQKDIWLVNLDPTIGVEIKKTRPCVILNVDSIGILPLKIIAPLTVFKKKFEIVPWMIKVIPNSINNLDKVSAIDTFQVRSVAKERLTRQTGKISENDLLMVLEALKVVFGIE